MIFPNHLQAEAQISYIVREISDFVEMIVASAGIFEQDVENQIIYL